MTELALKRIEENKTMHARGKDATVLDLSMCMLTEVPKEVEYLVWLEHLILSRNLWLTNISSIRNLINLTRLECSNAHQLINFDPIKGLYNLKHLNCSRTRLKDLSTISKLIKLTYLNCSDTLVDNLFPISDLENLEHLDCSNTHIDDISVFYGNSKLKELDISLTHVRDISPLIKIIESGIKIKLNRHVPGTSGIYVAGCPITTPPFEVIKKGKLAILRYFEELEQSGSDQIYEAKLLLIGEGGAGKTSLCEKLFDPNADLPQEKDRTRGIDIRPLYFDVPDVEGKQFRLNIWDFAGQGKYQSAHSFFYTHRSLYVFVDDTRTLNENDAYRTLYNNWLQTAELYGGESPVLVLHNEKKGCARTGFSIGSFKERFDFVHGELFRINLGGSETTKIIDLRHQIERRALALPHIGDTVPKPWVKVRDAIEKERTSHPYISIERYRELCAAEGITDPDKQSDLSHYFHDLGVFLHFPDNPILKRDIFLQNQWVTDAVYKILDDPQIAEEQRGRFTTADLKRLWNDGAYRDRRDELLALMLQFELCYQVQDSDTYICPQLLPGHVPAYDLGTGIPLQLKYEYVFMPKGMFYRLIVRLHRHIAQAQTAVWSSGVVLERSDSKADIMESLDQRTISVRATGLLAKELVTIINEEVERLHIPFGNRLRVMVKIPCNCRICKESASPNFYDKTDLDTRMLKSKPTVECRVSYDDVPVKGLLDGVFGESAASSQEEIIMLFQNGKTEEALGALCQLKTKDGALLLGRYLDAKRRYADGLILFEEFEKVANQVRAGGLDLLD